jgi:hypothetical protein
LTILAQLNASPQKLSEVGKGYAIMKIINSMRTHYQSVNNTKYSDKTVSSSRNLESYDHFLGLQNWSPDFYVYALSEIFLSIINDHEIFLLILIVAMFGQANFVAAYTKKLVAKQIIV